MEEIMTDHTGYQTRISSQLDALPTELSDTGIRICLTDIFRPPEMIFVPKDHPWPFHWQGGLVFLYARMD